MINNFLKLFELLSNQKTNDQDSIDLSRFYISKKKKDLVRYVTSKVCWQKILDA